VYYSRDEDVYQIVSGERRYHAAVLAGVQQIPCLVRDRIPNSSEVTQLQLIENLHRKDMSVLDESAAYKRLNEVHRLKLDDIARQVGKSKSHVSKVMRICDLADDLKHEVATSQLSKTTLSFEHLLEIARKKSAAEQWSLYKRVIGGRLSVKEMRDVLRSEAWEETQALSESPIGGEAEHEGLLVSRSVLRDSRVMPDEGENDGSAFSDISKLPGNEGKGHEETPQAEGAVGDTEPVAKIPKASRRRGRPKIVTEKWADPDGDFWVTLHFKKKPASNQERVAALRKIADTVESLEGSGS
jgi:ParB family chromosome partitioning protein